MQGSLTVTIEIDPVWEQEFLSMEPHLQHGLESGLLTERDVEQIALNLIDQHITLH